MGSLENVSADISEAVSMARKSREGKCQGSVEELKKSLVGFVKKIKSGGYR